MGTRGVRMRVASPFAKLVVCLVVAAVSSENSAAQSLEDSTRMVDVFGMPTRVLAIGLEEREPGQPVILLQAGAGTALEGWREWPEALSEFAPVVGYDRPGLGQSPFDGVDPTPERVAIHARELLDIIDVEPPYVLVGHSWGGPLILYFAAAYPDEVVGMVYIDPQDPRVSRAEMLLTEDEEEMDRRDAAYEEAVEAMGGSAPPPPGREAEGRARSEFRRRVPESIPADPPLPTAVVLTTRTPDMTGAPYYINEDFFREYHRVRVGRFVDWAFGRPETVLLITTDSGHFVYLDQPDLATQAVQHVLARVPR
jgi:pimeloyl-ACP methyl ester carboxylesterase